MSIQRGNPCVFPITSPQPLPLPSSSFSTEKSPSSSQSACESLAGFSNQNLKEDSYGHGPFLLDEESKAVDELPRPIENSLHQDVREKHAHDELQLPITVEGIDEMQDKRHSMTKSPIQDSEEKCEEANKEGSIQWHGSSSDHSVDPILSLSPGVRKAVLKRWWCGIEEKLREEEAEEERRISELHKEDGEGDDSNQRTRSINCIMNCESDVPFPIMDCVETYAKNQGSAVKKETGKQKGQPKGRKRMSDRRSRNFYLTIDYEAKETGVQGRKKKFKDHSFDRDIQHSPSISLVKQKQKESTPKHISDKPGKENGEPKRKRGRPKLDNENECVEKPKRKRKSRKLRCPYILC